MKTSSSVFFAGGYFDVLVLFFTVGGISFFPGTAFSGSRYCQVLPVLFRGIEMCRYFSVVPGTANLFFVLVLMLEVEFWLLNGGGKNEG